MGKPAVFLDRDGTLIDEVGFLVREEQIRIYEGTPAALRILRQVGFLLLVVSNQSGVARGFLSEERMLELNRVIFNQMRLLGEVPDAFYFCPHHPQALLDKYRQVCECRKPGLGLVRQAQQQFDLDLSGSYAVGDKLSDVALGQGLGGKGILVLTGFGAEERDKAAETGEICPDFVARDILEAAQWIAYDFGRHK